MNRNRVAPPSQHDPGTGSTQVVGLGFLQDDWDLAPITNIIPEVFSPPRTNIQAGSYHPMDPCLSWSLFPTSDSKYIFLSLLCRL